MYRTSFPEKAFLYLIENYGAFRDFVALKSELLVMFSDPDMAKDSAYDLYIYIYERSSTALVPGIVNTSSYNLKIARKTHDN
jgi:hypothetical protein